MIASRRVALSWLAGACCLPARAASAAAPEIERILRKRELTVALLDDDTPPFVYRKGGVLRGVDVELLEDVARELGVQPRFDRTAATYDEIVARVAAGEADLGASKLARTLARARSVLFSTPYLQLQHGLLVNRDSFARMAGERRGPEAVRGFDGTLGVLRGSAWEEFARRNFPRATVIGHAGWEQLVHAVATGSVIAAYRDSLSNQAVLRRSPDLALELRTFTFKDEASSLSVVASPTAPMVLAFVNEVIARRPAKWTQAQLLDMLG